MTATTLDIVIYSTPTCPDCLALKAWLASRGLIYTEKDLSDPRIMTEAMACTVVPVAPITLIDDRVFYGTFASQKLMLVEALGLGQAA